MDYRKSADHSEWNCCQNWHWVTLLIFLVLKQLCTMGSSHASWRDESSTFVALHSIVTADEKLVHSYGPKTKRRSMEYHYKGSHPRTKSRAQAPVGKLRQASFWGEANGVNYLYFLEPWTEIISERHTGALKTLERLPWIRTTKNVLRQHDKATPHTACQCVSNSIQSGLRAMDALLFTLPLQFIHKTSYINANGKKSLKCDMPLGFLPY